MPLSPTVKLHITAEGDRKSGKSLAIAEMIQGLKEGDHFHVTEVNKQSNGTLETVIVEVRLKYHATHAIEHEPLDDGHGMEMYRTRPAGESGVDTEHE